MTDSLQPATDRRRRRSQQAVLDAARQLFAHNGFRRTSVDELAERADVALSTIYTNFPGGKADVYVALACRIADEHAARMREAFAAAPAEDFVGAIFDAYCSYHRDEPLAFRLLGLVDVEPSDTDLYEQARASIGGVLGGLVDDAVAASGGEPARMRRRTLMMWAGVNGLLSLRSQGFVDADEYADMLVDLRAAVAGDPA